MAVGAGASGPPFAAGSETCSTPERKLGVSHCTLGRNWPALSWAPLAPPTEIPADCRALVMAGSV